VPARKATALGVWDKSAHFELTEGRVKWMFAAGLAAANLSVAIFHFDEVRQVRSHHRHCHRLATAAGATAVGAAGARGVMLYEGAGPARMRG